MKKGTTKQKATNIKTIIEDISKPELGVQQIFINFQKKQEDALEEILEHHYVLFGGAKGGGKAHSINTRIVTPFGFRRLGDIQKGEVILNPSGRPQRVIAIHPQGIQKTYKVTTIDGGSVLATLGHLWIYKLVGRKPKGKNRFLFGDFETEYRIGTTEELIVMLKKYDESKSTTRPSILIPLCNPLNFTKAYKTEQIIIDPYVLGVLIGNGSLTDKSVVLSTIDQEVIDRVRDLGYELSQQGKGIDYRFKNGQIIEKLTKLGLINHVSYEKFIPEYYKWACLEDRINLMQGLMDTDGYVDSRGHLSYTSVSERLIKDVQFVVRSLGGKGTITDKIPEYTYLQEKFKGRKAFTIYINTKINSSLVSVPRKKEKCIEDFNGGVSELHNKIIKIEEEGESECICITVSNPNGLYMTEDFIVTHNSFLGRGWMLGRRLTYPDTKGLIIRKTYPELDANHIRTMFSEYPEIMSKYYRRTDKMLELPNGSTIAYRYLLHKDDVYNFLGLEYDDIFIDEATQHSEETFRILSSSNRTTKKYIKPRMLLTSNPGGVGAAWCKRLFIDRKYRPNESAQDYAYVPARVYDNLILMENYPDYIKTLEGLPPEKRKAYLEGDWSALEGTFFEEWNEEKHIIKPICKYKELPSNWDYRLTWDDGTRAPRAVYLMAIDNDGKVQLVWEYYKAGETAPEAAYKIKYELEVLGVYDLIKDRASLIYDPSMDIKSGQTGKSTSDIVADILNIRRQPGNNTRIEGWRKMQEYMRWDDLTEPLFKVWNCCVKFIETIPTLVYDENNKEDLDCFVAGTKIKTPSGDVNIEDIKTGDLISTPIGNSEAYIVGDPKPSKLTRVLFSDGRELIGTSNHKVFVEGRGLIELQNLDCDVILKEWNTQKQTSTNNLLTMAKFIEDITEGGIMKEEAGSFYLYTGRFILTILEQFLKILKYITRMAALIIMFPRILILLNSVSIQDFTTTRDCRKSYKNKLNGAKQREGKGYTMKMQLKCLKEVLSGNYRALIVASILKPSIREKWHVQKLVRKLTGKNFIQKVVRFVAIHSFTRTLDMHKPVRIVAVGNYGEGLVYRLRVKFSHLYYANGFLCTNTDGDDHAADSIRYGLMSLSKLPTRLAGQRITTRNIPFSYKPQGGYFEEEKRIA